MVPTGSCSLRMRVGIGGSGALIRLVPGETLGKAIKEDVNDGGSVERKNLANEEASDHSDAERAAKFGAVAAAQGKGNAAEQCRHGGHHDRAKTQQACLIDGVGRTLSVFALGLESEVDNHDSVFLDDADQQNNSDDGNHAEILAEENEREKSANAG